MWPFGPFHIPLWSVQYGLLVLVQPPLPPGDHCQFPAGHPGWAAGRPPGQGTQPGAPGSLPGCTGILSGWLYCCNYRSSYEPIKRRFITIELIPWQKVWHHLATLEYTKHHSLRCHTYFKNTSSTLVTTLFTMLVLGKQTTTPILKNKRPAWHVPPYIPWIKVHSAI